MQNQVVSLNTAVTPYGADLAQIDQRQKLADLLASQSGQDLKPYSYNGIQAPISPMQGLNSIGDKLLSAYLTKKNINAQKDLSTKAQTDATNWMTELSQAPTDADRTALLMKGAVNPLTSSFAGPMLMQEVSRQRLISALRGENPSATGTPAPSVSPTAATQPASATPAPAGGVTPTGGAPSPASPAVAPSGPVPQATSAGGPAGGIPMQVWLAIDPTGKAYMEQLAKDNAPISTRYGIFARDPNNRNQFSPVGGALPQGALPYRLGPDGKVDVSPYPGQVAGAGAVAGAVAGAQAGAKFPYQTVTTPSGAQVPAFTVPGLVPGAKPSAPAAAAPVAPASAAPANAPPVPPEEPAAPQATATPTPAVPSVPMVGQSTASHTYGEEAGKAGVHYENEVNTGAANAVSQNRLLDDLSNNLAQMTPGKLAAVKKSIAQWKIAAGMGDENDKQIAASSEVSDKLTGQLVSNALKSMTARPTQAEFSIFLSKFVPNMEMTPNGANAVIGFMRQANNLNMQKQQAFQEWKKYQQPQNYRDFETLWNKRIAASPLSSQASFGAPAPAATPGGPQISPEDAKAELRRRGVNVP